MTSPHPPFGCSRRSTGFTLVELLVSLVVLGILAVLAFPAYRAAMASSSSAIAAATLRQLAAAGALYRAEHDDTYWPYVEYNAKRLSDNQPGYRWWFGFEPTASLKGAEGTRILLPDDEGLCAYIYGAGAQGLRGDPAFKRYSMAMKPKYAGGSFSFGYNGSLNGRRHMTIADPAHCVVFATSAQVNTFQKPATWNNPMIEEFYLIDSSNLTTHFRYGGKAMVVFADGSVGFLPIDESTRDPRLPEADIGLFAPRGDKSWLQ